MATTEYRLLSKVGAGEDLKENKWQSCEATVALSGMEIWLGLPNPYRGIDDLAFLSLDGCPNRLLGDESHCLVSLIGFTAYLD
jgi:hypothetical protein